MTGSCAARLRAAARGGEQAEDGCSKKSTSETFHFAPVSSPSPDLRATCLAYRYMSIPRRLVCARAFLIHVRVQVLHPYTSVRLQPCVRGVSDRYH